MESYKWKIIEDDWIHINREVLGEFLFCNWILVPERIAKQEEAIKYRIRNILWRNKISDLLILLSRYWLIKLTDNSSNYFEKEKEIKILNVDKEALVSKIVHKLWADKIFKWLITDMYYDTPELDITKWYTNTGKKSSLRIRHKVSKWGDNWEHYCTIKRKDWNSEDKARLRDCYEEEFKLFDSITFYKLLRIIGLIEYRMKVKKRVALSLWEVKFDFDKYEGIPWLLEIEAPESDIVEYYINEALNLSGNERLNGWTRALFEHYWKEMHTFIKPNN